MVGASLLLVLLLLVVKAVAMVELGVLSRRRLVLLVASPWCERCVSQSTGLTSKATCLTSCLSRDHA
jgi:hypothetical protein